MFVNNGRIKLGTTSPERIKGQQGDYIHIFYQVPSRGKDKNPGVICIFKWILILWEKKIKRFRDRIFVHTFHTNKCSEGRVSVVHIFLPLHSFTPLHYIFSLLYHSVLHYLTTLLFHHLISLLLIWEKKKLGKIDNRISTIWKWIISSKHQHTYTESTNFKPWIVSGSSFPEYYCLD